MVGVAGDKAEVAAGVADELQVIAREMDKAAAALVMKMTGTSRELRAWADRLRIQHTLILAELDRPSDPEYEPALAEATKTGRKWAQKAFLVLAAVSAAADAP